MIAVFIYLWYFFIVVRKFRIDRGHYELIYCFYNIIRKIHFFVIWIIDIELNTKLDVLVEIEHKITFFINWIIK